VALLAIGSGGRSEWRVPLAVAEDGKKVGMAFVASVARETADVDVVRRVGARMMISR
jgi:hypothetical protein